MAADGETQRFANVLRPNRELFQPARPSAVAVLSGRLFCHRWPHRQQLCQQPGPNEVYTRAVNSRADQGSVFRHWGNIYVKSGINIRDLPHR